jgi:2-polyprenyl-6-hydroxyphenyl methylase / 3-demethylubiquinone-9 3-methyltransferase
VTRSPARGSRRAPAGWVGWPVVRLIARALGPPIDRTVPAPPARVTLERDWADLPDHLWWDPHGPAKLLHAMNPVRTGWYLDQLGEPAGRLILDAGCGGGLVSRELAAAGVEVVGIDLGLGSLNAARRAVPVRFRPVLGRLESLPFADGSFDAVVAADVLEHIPDLPGAVRELARVLRPGGRLLLDTINRTPWAWFVGVFGAERVTGLVPRGTHDWRLFIRPEELDRVLRAAGLVPVAAAGLAPSIGPADIARGLLTRRIDPPAFQVGSDRRASYFAHYRKASG